ncbi:MAG: ABC transporter permease [Candidatus Xenobiia bacterium LiM19]
MIRRLITIIKKEFIQIRRNTMLLRMLLLMPVMQMVVFGYAAVLDIKNIDTAVLDKDRSSYSRAVLDVFRTSSYFILKYQASSEEEISSMLDREDILCGIVIPPDFGRKVEKGSPVSIQVIVDGTNSSAANVISNYSASSIAAYANTILKSRGLDVSRFGSLNVEMRFLYNPSLDNKYFFIPGIFAMIILILGTPITAMAIVREKEQGTLEQIIVTPIKPVELIIGKVLPYTILIIISSIGILIVTLLWFHLPLRGDLPALFLAIVLFLLNALGLGIFISTISQTQQQSILTSFFFILPLILFSGFLFPIANMPPLFRSIADVNPMRYFLDCARNIFLKGSGWEDLMHGFIALALTGIVIFTASILLFKKRAD